jgi:hypothetical protein
VDEGFSLKKYKKIHLYWKEEEEEYEISYDNIGQLLVTQGEEDISKQCKIVFNFSKEALIGFGSYCIRKSQNFIYNTHVHIEPLGEYLANQGMGFFLTPASSELIVKCEGLGNLKELGLKYDSNKILKNNIKYNKFELDYLVDLDFDNDYFECHNLDFNNIAELKVMEGEQDISKKCRIIFILSKNGMLGLGTQLLRLAHNFNNVDRCLVTPFEGVNLNCLLGFFLTPNSAILEVGCETFKDVFYYDPNFGYL